MKLIVKYFFMTLVIIQVSLLFLWFSNINFFWILSWINSGGSTHYLRLFFPLIIYSFLKIAYWFAEPIAELINILLKWIVVIGIFYFLYWLIFI